MAGYNADASVGESEHSTRVTNMFNLKCFAGTAEERYISRRRALIYKGPQTLWSTAVKRKAPAWSHFTLISIALLVFVDTIYIAKAQCMQENSSSSSVMQIAG